MADGSRRRTARARERLLAELPDLGEILRGSLVTRYRRCGKATCHCAAEGDPGHGPAFFLTATVAPGRTVAVYVPERRRDEVERYLANFRRVREILEEVSTLNRSLLKEGKLFPGG